MASGVGVGVGGHFLTLSHNNIHYFRKNKNVSDKSCLQILQICWSTQGINTFGVVLVFSGLLVILTHQTEFWVPVRVFFVLCMETGNLDKEPKKQADLRTEQFSNSLSLQKPSFYFVLSAKTTFLRIFFFLNYNSWGENYDARKRHYKTGFFASSSLGIFFLVVQRFPERSWIRHQTCFWKSFCLWARSTQNEVGISRLSLILVVSENFLTVLWGTNGLVVTKNPWIHVGQKKTPVSRNLSCVSPKKVDWTRTDTSYLSHLTRFSMLPPCDGVVLNWVPHWFTYILP